MTDPARPPAAYTAGLMGGGVRVEQRADPAVPAGDLAGSGGPLAATAAPGRAVATRRVLEAAALALAPVAVFLGLHVRPMAVTNIIDPYLHTAYLENGAELMRRFGTSGFTASYQWVRVGFILPAHVFFSLFGAVGGFYAFRYALALLAVIPAFLLFRRLHGPAAGWIAALVVLTCPVILTAWGSDYPDSAAVSYLLAGTACLVMPAAPSQRRLWLLAAGALFALAVHSHVVAVLAAGGAVAAFLAVTWRRRSASALPGPAVLLAAAALGVTAILLAGSEWYYGHANVLRPTVNALRFYHQPSEVVKFHSSSLDWLLFDVYLLVPPAAVAGWLAVAWRRRERLPDEETALALGVALALLAYVLAEFVGRSWTLEYYLYSSLLFAGGTLVVAALVVRVSGPLLRLGAWALAPAGLVVAVPVLLRPLRGLLQLELPLAALVALAVVAAALATKAGFSSGPARRLPLVTIAVAAVTALTVGLPLQRPAQAGQAGPDYGSVLFAEGGPAVDDYAVASQLRTVVPSTRSEPGAMLLWWPASHQPVVDEAACQFLWSDGAVHDTMPALDDADVAYLNTKGTRWLVLLSDDGREFDAAAAQLRAHGFTVSTWRERTLASGSVSMRVRVVRLGP